MNTWDKFFGNPLIRSYITEADEVQAPEPEESLADPEQMQELAANLKEGSLSQDDLIQMYKSGKLSKDDIQMIIDGAQDASQEEIQTDGEPGEEQPTEEELFAQQIDQTNDMFIKFALYDKVSDLIEKLDYFKENFEDIQSESYGKVIQLGEFLNILSNLIFNIETSVSYQMYGGILLQLTEIFNEYKEKGSAEELHDNIKDKEKEGYRDGSKTSDPVEQWADKNQYHDMPQEAGSTNNQNNTYNT